MFCNSNKERCTLVLPTDVKTHTIQSDLHFWFGFWPQEHLQMSVHQNKAVAITLVRLLLCIKYQSQMESQVLTLDCQLK